MEVIPVITRTACVDTLRYVDITRKAVMLCADRSFLALVRVSKVGPQISSYLELKITLRSIACRSTGPIPVITRTACIDTVRYEDITRKAAILCEHRNFLALAWVSKVGAQISNP